MEDMLGRLRKRYENFKNGKEDVLAVRDEALLVLVEAKKKGDGKIVEEVEDILMDLLFSIEENKCGCHPSS